MSNIFKVLPFWMQMLLIILEESFKLYIDNFSKEEHDSNISSKNDSFPSQADKSRYFSSFIYSRAKADLQAAGLNCPPFWLYKGLDTGIFDSISFQ